jgi:hypothetical protein
MQLRRGGGGGVEIVHLLEHHVLAWNASRGVIKVVSRHAESSTE